MDQNELPLDTRHLGVLPGVPKMISTPVVYSVQTVHLSCAKTNTISKRTEISFHLTCIMSEYHRVCPKRIPCPWDIRRKPFTFLAPKLKLSRNRSKRASAWATSLRSTIRCLQNDFWAFSTLAQTLHLSSAENNTISKWFKTSFHLSHIT
jgi:hypothetical protein